MATGNFINIHLAADLSPSKGGPSRSIISLTNHLSKKINNVFLISQSKLGEPKSFKSFKSVTKIVPKVNSAIAFIFGWSIRKELIRQVKRETTVILHSHGLWLFSNYWASYYAKKNNCIHIIQPRGMLEPWALNHKKIRKYFAMQIYQGRNIERADALVATSQSEYENIRKLGFKNPIAIIPNGTDFNKSYIMRPIFVRKKKVALFLSRIHEKKGLFNLIEAWSKLNNNDWSLVIAGPDENDYMRKVLNLSKKLGVFNKIKYVGQVDGRKKSDLYRQADLFILPSFSENFGLVITEALSYGLPVITTKGTPWHDLEIYKCGWWIDIGVEPLLKAINSAITLNDSERKLMGARGKVYVKRYNWESASAKTFDLYLWLINMAPKPEFVYLD